MNNPNTFGNTAREIGEDDGWDELKPKGEIIDFDAFRKEIQENPSRLRGTSYGQLFGDGNSEEEYGGDKAAEFVDKIDPRALIQVASSESTTIKKLLRQKYEFEKNIRERGFIEKFQYKLAMNGLIRSGYNPNGENSSLFDTLAKVDPESSVGEATLLEIGSRRAENWKNIDLGLNGAKGRQLREALKEAGFSKIPKSWDDDGFTADEISRMAAISSYD